MTPTEITEEENQKLSEYKAIKKLLGSLLVENNEYENNDPKIISYFTRKFEESRKKIKGR